ncbi:ScbA/BarX family gamma-butyrolactone biosynthesis protein [Streptomyces harbinensis]|uniref:ScbA/BarX family gamma-butyrolactone biosynthesis protein n=1 Tax=Streptomyces harbinensis TaxID=1176198 RepID=UPI00371B5271
MCALTLADHQPRQPQPAPDPQLFLQTVPRTLVHRASVAEVLVTGLRDGGQDTFVVGAQWPRGHSYYRAADGRRHDPMLLGECIRQAVLLISHEGMRISLGHHFFSHTTSYEVDPDGARLADRPADIVLTARLAGIKRRGTAVGGFEAAVDCHREGRLIGHGTMTMTCVPKATYRRLRGGRADARAPRPTAAPVPPGTVGRREESDVVIAGTGVEGVWSLRVDPDHPVLFDHPVDHVPGMVVMEAARQAALAALGRPDGLATGCAITFERFVEFGVACLVTAGTPVTHGDGRHTLPVRFTQEDVTVASAEVTLWTGR